MSATGKTDSASAAASLPNPNSTVGGTQLIAELRGMSPSAHLGYLKHLFSCLVIFRNVCLLTAVVDAVGNSLSAILDGEARLTFLNRGEDYVMNMPYAHCKGKTAACLSFQ